MTTHSYTVARSKLKSLMDEACDGDNPVLITRRNGGNVFIISEEEYSQMGETAYLLSNPANRQHLQETKTELKKGKTKTVNLKDL